MITVKATAKINLGLEVTGKRPDGYHDLVTVMAKVNIVDTISVGLRSDRTIRIRGMKNLHPAQNIMFRAVQELQRAFPDQVPGVNISIAKTIPESAGMGGGSSDAASVLHAVAHLADLGISPKDLAAIALKLGADVPFFLDGPCALATGIGDRLAPLPAPTGHLVIATPALRLRNKTPRLYKSLDPADFTDGSRTREMAALLETGTFRASTVPHNAFLRPLSGMSPRFVDAIATFQHITDSAVHLTGSGPTLYTLVDEEDEAEHLADDLRATEKFRYVAATDFSTDPPPWAP